MGCEIWSVNKDLDTEWLQCWWQRAVYFVESSLWNALCMREYVYIGRVLDLILLFHSLPLWTKLSRGCSLLQKAQTKYTFQKRIKCSNPSPLAPCFLQPRWANLSVTGGASFHSMSITDCLLCTRHCWKSSEESKKQMLCSFQEEEINPCHHSGLKIAVR